MSTSVAAHTERTTRRLRHLQAFEIAASRLLGGWLPGIVSWEAKHQVALHLWENAQHSRDLRTRLWELRVPDPDRDLDGEAWRAIRRLAAAQHDAELLAGAYLVLAVELRDAYLAQLDRTHPVYDAPSVPVLKRIVADKDRQIAWAEREIDALVSDGDMRRNVTRWKRYAREVLLAAGGVDGAGERHEPPAPPPSYELLLPFLEAKRDPRFDLQLQSGIEADEGDRLGQVLYQFANYGAEMQAAETLGSTLWEADEMPWEFYFDVARHGYDEARHSKLGETRLAELGYHLTDFPHSVANYTWRQMMDPMRRYCTLTYVIEADSFQYKQETYQKHLEHGDQESAQAVLFDITDETLHVRWGKKWVPELIERYGYDGSVKDLVRECREHTAKHSASPLQRGFADTTR